MTFDLMEYVSQTRDFMVKTCGATARDRVELAVDQLKFTLTAFGGFGRPDDQEIDTDRVAIKLSWRKGQRVTSIEFGSSPGYSLEWRADNETPQKLAMVLHGSPAT